MKFFSVYFVVCVSFLLGSCKRELNRTEIIVNEKNSVLYAEGFSLVDYDDYSVLKITQPWNNTHEVFTYVLYRSELSDVPDSLKSNPLIKVPISSIVVTSTTHIPSLVALDEESSLRGFPGLNYISSESVRTLIEANKIAELGQAESLNPELILDLEPDVVVAFAMDDVSSSLKVVENSGVRVIYNGDWVEQTPLGKAEWIKLFGALYDKQSEAAVLYDHVVKEYKEALGLLAVTENRPSVMSGAMYQDVWYAPQGDSWMAEYFKDAKSDYIWRSTVGTGSLALSFEKVFAEAQSAEYWINPAQYESLDELATANPHYTQFESFKKGSVYSFARRKGKTGGSLFYELGPSRPDLILKDLIYILHPTIDLNNYEPFFFEQLQ